MTDDELMEALVQNACFSADTVAIGFQGTPHQKTRAVIKRALEALVANGLIEVTPPDEWPKWYVPDPPYKVKF